MYHRNGGYCIPVPGDAAGRPCPRDTLGPGVWPQPWDSWLHTHDRGTSLLGVRAGLRVRVGRPKWDLAMQSPHRVEGVQ